MIKLIASDLDGTLLFHGAQTLPDGICEKIHQLQEQGILFCAASGRQYQNLRRLFAPVADDIAYNAENGSLVCYRNRILYQSVIERELGLDILRTIRSLDGCEMLLSCANGHYMEPKCDAFSYHMHYIVRNKIEAVSDILKVEEPFIKISIYEPGGYRPETEQRIRNLYEGQVQIVTAGNGWLDMMPLHTHKGTAIRKLSEALQIPLSEMAAIGDNLNDMEMLAAVGHPVCVHSAHPAVKEICPLHTRTVGEYLKQFL